MVFNVYVEINSSKSFVVNPVHHPVQPSEWQLEPSVFGHGFAAEAHNEVAQWRLVERHSCVEKIHVARASVVSLVEGCPHRECSGMERHVAFAQRGEMPHVGIALGV